MREIGFIEAFTFIFSPREGTPATRLPASEMIPAAVAGDRLQRLVDVIRAGARAQNVSLLGRRYEILVEK